MLVRDVRQVKAQKVQQWWSRVRHYVQLSHRLSSKNADDLNRVQDIEACIDNLTAQFQAVEAIPYPESAHRIRSALLAFQMNMITVLQHTRLHNNDDRKVIYDIAMVDKHMVELYLEEFGLSL